MLRIVSFFSKQKTFKISSKFVFVNIYPRSLTIIQGMIFR
ncbi:unnamed protein product [Leptidea sinapis]|uniref:Uncharacterized protein n=1 Tax=Leptidea sinapis TaxID=189913 RepID=A0A5E4Q269_9NEOP|nr:unnamed protein product [Leptidea sinapis]